MSDRLEPYEREFHIAVSPEPDALGHRWFIWPWRYRGFDHRVIVARGVSSDYETARASAKAACRLLGGGC